MQIDHPRHGTLIIARVKHVLRSAASDLLQAALLFIDLHLDLVDLVVSTLAFVLKDLSVHITDIVT